MLVFANDDDLSSITTPTQNNVLKPQGSALCKQTAMSHMHKLFLCHFYTEILESRIHHLYTYEKMVSFPMREAICAALIPLFVYPLMTLLILHHVIAPCFASITHSLHEEFARKYTLDLLIIYRGTEASQVRNGRESDGAGM